MLFSTKSVYILCIYTVKGTICHFQASMLGVSLGYGWGMLGDGLDGVPTGSRRAPDGLRMKYVVRLHRGEAN